ncbi:glycosyl hydrolase family 28-related protein [Aeromonas jandaei]|uniref:glycosyl hydrolase family 28-related protein n=1 Tax=Aeromonas jandaei TaxID=650 RepID=UPI003B9E7E8C
MNKDVKLVVTFLFAFAYAPYSVLANTLGDTLCLGESIKIDKSVANIAPAYFSTKERSTQPATVICAADYGITPGLKDDMASKLNDLIVLASSMYKDEVPVVIYLPSGSYHVESQIYPKSGVRLVGSSQYGPSILRSKGGAIIHTGGDWYTELDNFQIEQLYFDNIRAIFNGGRKQRIASILNVFFNTKSQDEQLLVEHKGKHVISNVFLRNEQSPGIGLYTYATKDAEIRGNIFGNAIALGYDELWSGKVTHAREYTGYEVYQLFLKPTHELAQSRRSQIDNFFVSHLYENGHDSFIFNDFRKQPQGNFTIAWFSNMDDGLSFVGNVLENDGEKNAFNPMTSQRDIDNSLLATLQHHKNITINKSYFGSHKKSDAALVIRNGERLSLVLNHFRNIDVNQRDWEDAPINDFHVHANRFSETAKYNYYSNNNHTTLNPPQNVYLSYNVFEEQASGSGDLINANGMELFCVYDYNSSLNTNTKTVYELIEPEYGRIPDDGLRAQPAICAGNMTIVNRDLASASLSSWSPMLSYGERLPHLDKRFTDIGKWKTMIK